MTKTFKIFHNFDLDLRKIKSFLIKVGNQSKNEIVPTIMLPR